MQTKQGHTPTPIKYYVGNISGKYILSYNKMAIGEIRDETNAAFIVKAVNCHYEFVEASYQARAYIENNMDTDEAKIYVLNTIEQALKKASE